MEQHEKKSSLPGFLELSLKSIVIHTITYFLVGMFAASFLDYSAFFARPEMACWMRQIDDPMIMAGPLFQPIRGFIFALVFYPLRETLFTRKNGWLIMWWILVALGTLSTFGPAPGSVEGMIYTVIPIPEQLRGWIEVIPQALLLSIGVFYWIKYPDKKWLNGLLWTIFVLFILFSVLGLLMQ